MFTRCPELACKGPSCKAVQCDLSPTVESVQPFLPSLVMHGRKHSHRRHHSNTGNCSKDEVRLIAFKSARRGNLIRHFLHHSDLLWTVLVQNCCPARMCDMSAGQLFVAAQFDVDVAGAARCLSHTRCQSITKKSASEIWAPSGCWSSFLYSPLAGNALPSDEEMASQDCAVSFYLHPEH